MSYYMSQLGDGDFIIRRKNKSAAMNALRNWERTVLRKGESPLFGHAENLEDMLHALGWETSQNESGDIVEISFIDDTLCDEDQWMNAIAPSVERGSIIKMHGEDDCLWCWYFDGKCCTRYSGEVVFPDIPDEERAPIHCARLMTDDECPNLYMYTPTAKVPIVVYEKTRSSVIRYVIRKILESMNDVLDGKIPSPVIKTTTKEE